MQKNIFYGIFIRRNREKRRNIASVCISFMYKYAIFILEILFERKS